jgi:hypothetical protein
MAVPPAISKYISVCACHIMLLPVYAYGKIRIVSSFDRCLR